MSCIPVTRAGKCSIFILEIRTSAGLAEAVRR